MLLGEWLSVFQRSIVPSSPRIKQSNKNSQCRRCGDICTDVVVPISIWPERGQVNHGRCQSCLRVNV
jgi:hypothetical protein